MEKDRLRLRNHLVFLTFLSIVLVISIFIYSSQTNNFGVSQNNSFEPEVINSELLKNWLPPTSYRYTLNIINNYLLSNQVQASSITVYDNLTTDTSDGGSYNFTILIEPQNQTYGVAVAINNLDKILSTIVSINGQTQSYSLQSQINGTQYGGISNLLNAGTTTFQVEEFEIALQKFSPSATNIVVNSRASTSLPVNSEGSSSVSTQKFSLNIDGVIYNAKLNLVGLNSIELFLFNPKTGGQVFNSGDINQI